MIKLKSLLGKPQSPSFQVLAEIMQAKGVDRVLRQHRSIRFPNGTCQIWGFVALEPETEVQPMVIAVFIRHRRLVAWKVLSMSFDEALHHYRLKADGMACEPEHPAAEHPPVSLPPGVTVVWPESRSLSS